MLRNLGDSTNSKCHIMLVLIAVCLLHRIALSTRENNVTDQVMFVVFDRENEACLCRESGS